MAKKAVRVLIVDDSRLFREVLLKGLSQDSGIEVVGTAADAFEARDRIIELMPDVMTLDVQMPRMNGIEFLKKLLPQHPMPVVVVSSVNDIVFDALSAGAVDFTAKPERQTPEAIQSFIQELAVKVKIASISNVSSWKRGYQPLPATPAALSKSIQDRVLAIGASTGGTEAIFEVVRKFPRDMIGTVIVQHMPPVFTRMYADRLNHNCAVEVLEAKDGDEVKTGRVLIAPGDIHIQLIRKGKGYYVRYADLDKVNGHRPSVDVLFDSVAQAAGQTAIGVILTGMGSDGAKGLLNMKQKGASTIGQSEESCIVYGMPKVAWEIGAVDHQLALKDITERILRILNGKNI